MDKTRDPSEAAEAIFTINGKLHTVGGDVPLNTSLNTYIRDYALLTGTKFMCKEGSCGSCVVNLKYYDKIKRKQVSLAVNSCLMPVLTCQGCAITTVEGLGSRSTGYNKVPTTLAHFNGTQCGFCSPGFVMSMYSLLDENPKATAEDVENNFSGNLCRCTGYRPILDAFKSLSSNPPIKLKQRLLEIEESHILCPNRGNCSDSDDIDHCSSCMNNIDDNSFELDFSEMTLSDNRLYISRAEGEYYRAMTLKEIFEIFDRIGPKSYILLAGNTARGVKPLKKEPEVYIDINNVNDLKGITTTSSHFTFGSMTRQTELINGLRLLSKRSPTSYGFATQMANHLSLVANVPVRNRATIGGNLGLVLEMKNFPSDIFLLLDALEATITIANVTGSSANYSPTQFRTLDMKKKVIVKIAIPAQNNTTKLLSYKIMPVSQSAPAMVNGAFLYDVDKQGQLNRKPSLVFSGINAEFRHATNTEKYLAKKNIINSNVLQGAVKTLWNELKPDNELTSFSPDYRKLLAAGIFYKSVLNLAGDKADAKLRSGGSILTRPLSSGKQTFQTDKKEYPLTQPMPKLEAQIQCTGEAKFINDIPKQQNELAAQLVLAKKFADIAKVDASKALKLPGVVAFFSANDIPGKNNVCIPYLGYFTGALQLFSAGKVSFLGQPVGVIVAETQDIADHAANEVLIIYGKPKTTILLNIRDVLNSKEKDERTELQTSQKATSPGSGGKYDFSGEVDITTNGQYAHAMETQVCRVNPKEEGQFEVYASTQTMTVTTASIAQVMNIPQNKIDCIVPRVGGSFGSKNTSHLFAACSCTLAASKLQRPVRMVMPVPSEMDAIGKRVPFYAKYTGKCDNNGKIQGMDVDVYADYGFVKIMNVFQAVIPFLANYFDVSTWNINVYNVITDKTPMLILRGPGYMESITIAEEIMDHVAFVSKLSPVNVRLANSSDKQMNSYISDWVKQTNFDSRKQEIDKFNSENRWKKKGLSITGVRYAFSYIGTQFGCSVGILFPDGTVQVQHAGIEMGQGLNTKVVQAIAYELGVPLSMIQMKSPTTLNGPNSTPSWTSTSSELVVYSAVNCCSQLNSNLEPVKKSLKNPTWQQIVEKAYYSNVPLSAYVPLMKYPDTYSGYFVYGLSVAETEIDVLTGQNQIVRVDILEDVGKSMSPEVDVGQIEGGFIMALGLHTTERLVYDPKTGALLTNRLWNYHVPRSLDIPIDFRVTFVPNSTNPNGVLNSKATGEPSTALAVSVVNSLRYAIMAARDDAGLKETWVHLASPCTPETVLMATGTAKEQFII